MHWGASQEAEAYHECLINMKNKVDRVYKISEFLKEVVVDAPWCPHLAGISGIDFFEELHGEVGISGCSNFLRYLVL